MASNRRGAYWYAAGFVIAAALAASGIVVPWDRAVGSTLAPLGRAVPWLNLVWVLGGPPVTGLIAVMGSALTRQWRWLGLWMVGLVLEVATKHFIHTPLPTATPEPLWLARIESWTNPSPHVVLSVLTRWMHVQRSHGGTPLLAGSFFSGHVFRITFTVGMLFPRRQWVPWAAAAAAAAMVLATGGHWLIDTVGAVCMAGVLLRLAR